MCVLHQYDSTIYQICFLNNLLLGRNNSISNSNRAMEGVLSPRESGRLISETAKDVFIDRAGVTKVAQLVSLLRICTPF